MQLDPTTVCLRSFSGEDEVRKATHGLSLVQRIIEAYAGGNALAPTSEAVPTMNSTWTL